MIPLATRCPIPPRSSVCMVCVVHIQCIHVCMSTKVKVVLHSAVSSPSDRSKRYPLVGLPWQTCSFRDELGFSGKHSSHAAITRLNHSHFHNCIMARYSFIQLCQQGRQWRERKCPIFETVAKGDSNPGSLDCKSGILPLSYRALHY